MYLLLYEVLSLGHVCVTHMQCKFYPVMGISCYGNCISN